MVPKDSKTTLWNNIAALMQKRYGGEKLSQFARDAGIGAATMTRLKVRETSVGVDVLDSIATKFALEPWQLLAPGLGADLYVLKDGLRLVSSFSGDGAAQTQRKAPKEISSAGLDERLAAVADPVERRRREMLALYIIEKGVPPVPIEQLWPANEPAANPAPVATAKAHAPARAPNVSPRPRR